MPTFNRRSVLLGGIVSPAVAGLTPSRAAAVGAYANGELADRALRYLNQRGGQCRSFVNKVVSEVSGGTQNTQTGGGDYFAPLARYGQRILDINALTKGDIVQVGQTGRTSNLHTFIIIGRVGGSTFDVVDSNSKRDEVVRRYNRSNVFLDDSRRAYRLGTSSGQVGASQIAFQANTGHLYRYNGVPADLDQGMMGGTSPAIAALPGGGYEMAFQANTGDLYAFGDAGSFNTRQGMMRGTSPAIAASPQGGWQIAFQANTGILYQYHSQSGSAYLGQGMMDGTSPAIAALPGGGYEMAFQANTGDLYAFGDAGSFNTRQGMMRGTSPAIAALASGGFLICFQANTGDLYTYDSRTGASNLSLGMMNGTSPGVAAL